ncbi:hypothetical protein AMK26_24650 [Streptomyces sp. CB03234]|uniref:DUF5949 family protein n=1 Tax=Streptomyces sp. (strain CB03234) TaxID=1703937 RepID=UPI000939C052|nr:DUF5949 family protein [Streptomyces sp. CB03234]OKK02769.1 hypothetical protein AMK26_24650 [Streptomyces sp. CB03234]
MTSSTAVTPGRQESLLGTLAVIAWASKPESDADSPVTPFLMVYSLGDGRDGPEAGADALRSKLEETGLSIGDKVTDLSRETRIPITLLVEAEQAVLNLPFMKVQCPVQPEWEKAAHESGTAYLICALLPWPEAVQGKSVSEEELLAFLGDDDLVAKSAHCLLPVRRVRT